MAINLASFYSPVGARWGASFALSGLAWGVAFGIAATAKMPAAMATAMSAFASSGTAQLVAVQLWNHPLPVAAILLSVLSINARYLAMGATLAPLYEGRTRQGLIGTIFLSDASWAIALRAAEEGHDPHAALLTCNALMWFAWVGGTLAGALAGSFVPELMLAALGWFVLALLASLIPPLVRSLTTAIGSTAAAVIALVIDPWLGGSWHVLVAGVIGGGIAYALGTAS
jgi:predicted branched-subunit amino acid permease